MLSPEIQKKIESCGRCDAHIGPGKDGDRATCPKCGPVEYAHTCSCGTYCWRSPFDGSFGPLSHHEFGEELGAPGWFPVPGPRNMFLGLSPPELVETLWGEGWIPAPSSYGLEEDPVLEGHRMTGGIPLSGWGIKRAEIENLRSRGGRGLGFRHYVAELGGHGTSPENVRGTFKRGEPLLFLSFPVRSPSGQVFFPCIGERRDLIPLVD